jgi:hypothetical protein
MPLPKTASGIRPAFLRASMKRASLDAVALLFLSILASCSGHEGDNYTYIDLYDPEAYRKEHQAKLDKLRATNRDLVASYHDSLPKELTRVRGSTASQCGGTPRHYAIRKGPEKMAQVELDLFFVIDDGLKDKGPEVYQKVAGCFSEVSAMWQRNGIELVIKSKFGTAAEYLKLTQGIDYNEGPFSITLLPGIKRSSSRQYYIEGEDHRLCPMIAHELGHTMGLPDEYIEAGTCRQEIFSEYATAPYNIMASPSDLVATDPYPRNIRELLDPVVARKLGFDKTVYKATLGDLKGQPVFPLIGFESLGPSVSREQLSNPADHLRCHYEIYNREMHKDLVSKADNGSGLNIAIENFYAPYEVAKNEWNLWIPIRHEGALTSAFSCKAPNLDSWAKTKIKSIFEGQGLFKFFDTDLGEKTFLELYPTQLETPLIFKPLLQPKSETA